uniref:Serpin domain-containing protein n=1 Tax=Timema douglasi TaxID=61478 RepID=A0A7R8VKM9_TIMDO|nr:unnamed protein product [Timema douglasi]
MERSGFESRLGLLRPRRISSNMILGVILLVTTTLTRPLSGTTLNFPVKPQLVNVSFVVKGNETGVLARVGNGGDVPFNEGIRFLQEGSNEGLSAPQSTRDTNRDVWRSHVERLISRGILQLALRLQETLPANDENVIYSPLSISGALNQVWLGARGRTAIEVAEVLGLSSDLERESVLESYRHLRSTFEHVSGVTLPQTSVANALFLQEGYPVLRGFAELSRDLYRSEVLAVDFSGHASDAQAQINKWVESKTLGRLKNFLSSAPSRDTRMLIANAIYFNGEWEYPFMDELTYVRPFTVTGGEPQPGASTSETILVPMMTNAAELPYSDNNRLNCRVVGLPYKGREVIMYLVLPRDTGLDALRALKERLSVDDIEELISSTKELPVIVSIPRMHLESTINLKDALEALGVHSLFDPSKSDLGGISPGYARNDTFSLSMRIFEDDNTSTTTPTTTKTTAKSDESYRPAEVTMTMEEKPAIETSVNPGLYADDVIHKVEIEVTEKGTVASAATAVIILRDGSHHVVRFDRPFLFFIRHEPTKFVLFWGSVVRPARKGTPGGRINSSVSKLTWLTTKLRFYGVTLTVCGAAWAMTPDRRVRALKGLPFESRGNGAHVRVGPPRGGYQIPDRRLSIMISYLRVIA